MNKGDVAHPWRGLIGLSILSSTAFLDYTIVYTSLPAIQASLKVPVIQLQWVMNIFTLALATIMVLAGKLGDIFGKRKVFTIGVSFFGIAAIGAGFSPNFGSLIFFRALQGITAAILFTSSAALAPLSFKEDDRPRAIGIYTAITGFGLAIGPFLGGVLVSLLGWRFVFFVNIPLIVIGFGLFFGNVNESERSDSQSIDWLGVLLMLASFGLLVLTILHAAHIGWLNKVTLSGVVVSLVFFFLLYYREVSIDDPLIDLVDVKNPKILIGMTQCATASLMTAGMMFLMPLYLHNVLGVSSLYLGLLMLCTPIMQVLVSVVWEKVYADYGIYKPIIFSIVTLLVSAVIQYCYSTETSLVVVVIALLLMGIIWGVTNTGGITLATTAVKPEKVGGAIGLIYTNWNTSSVVILALITTIFTTSEFSFMQSALKTHHIKLTTEQHHLISASIGDPSHAHQILDKLVGSSAEKLMALFKLAFVHGYQQAMLFSIILLVLCLILMTWLIRLDKYRAHHI